MHGYVCFQKFGNVWLLYLFAVNGYNQLFLNLGTILVGSDNKVTIIKDINMMRWLIMQTHNMIQPLSQSILCLHYLGRKRQERKRKNRYEDRSIFYVTTGCGLAR